TAERAAGRAGGGVRPPKGQRTPSYDPDCTLCPRLAEFLAESHHTYPNYFSRPVPSFGSDSPRLVIVGLAPGMHGANRTGRPFTGDFAGILLYETLHALGVAPENKPLPDEIRRCNARLQTELQELPSARVILALGRIAHESVLLAYGL